MRTLRSLLVVFIRRIVPASLVVAASLTHAGTLWTGPNIGFFHTPANGLQDEWTTNVIITRGGGGGLYNSAPGEDSGAVSGISPKGTAWAMGTLANTNLTYGPCLFEAGHAPAQYIGKTFVVHLLTNDIYLQLTLTNWGGAGGTPGQQTFGYIRSTPAVITPTTTVTITNPVSGAIFAAPASVTIQAMATNSAAAVTNVQFFTNNVLLGTVTSSPFNITANNLAASSYALKAIATGAGISATSAVVNITVDAPPSVTITNPANNATFSAPANVTVQVSASDADGTVTNVQFLVGSSVLTNETVAPFSAATNNLASGSYTLSAVASDNLGVKNTNSISISVVTPVTVSLANSATVASTNFQFSYAANVGLSYVVQVSTNLALGNWISLVTNVAGSNPVVFVDTHATNNSGFYRVGRLPNP